jgi:tetratricopeptide (TPR) repeat protein
MLPPQVFEGEGLSKDTQDLLEYLKNADFEKILSSHTVREHLAFDEAAQDWTTAVEDHIQKFLEDGTPETRYTFLIIGLCTLHAFLQANVTGPPLSWDSSVLILGQRRLTEKRQSIIASLSSDGEAAYHLSPHVELFALAKTILNHPKVYSEDLVFAWARASVNYWHQQLLDEASPSIQEIIYQDLSFLDSAVLDSSSLCDPSTKVLYLLQRAAVNIFHGFDKKAREDLKQATEIHGFEYVLTGRLGRRTKFQQFDITQLVVLAKSRTEEVQDSGSAQKSIIQEVKPENLDLNDDTLLESISFTNDVEPDPVEEIPAGLKDLDPSNQPVLDPLDSIILLSVASSITNTSPQHGLTREETLPYATRVLDGGSTNWQLYTQALLVRSRIEGFKSRTVERGVLQLQALVDQVIAETTGSTNTEAGTTTFLPKPKPSESAPASERLLYIHQLSSPLRWSLEAELASRWVSLGSLRTALEIFERLEMWAEVALCWAATDREDKARKIIRRQLYLPVDPEGDKDAEEYLGEEHSPLPTDAPRLLCILGDIEKKPELYERAWTVSNNRYARAQRSLGKHYVAKGDLEKADEAYTKSLIIHRQHAPTWFSLGCVRLETCNWKGAIDAFTRTVQIEEEDAEAWSNLAAALLRLPPGKNQGSGEEFTKQDPQKHTKEAFLAFKRATTLKRDSYRIWQNLLNVGVTLSPPPYTDIIIAQQRLIDLRSDVEGEGCVDIEVMEGLLNHIIRSEPTEISSEPRKRYGLENMFTDLVTKSIVPLITQSRELWKLVAQLAIHQKKYTTALDAYEKAWRITLNKPGWDDGSGVASSSTSVTHIVSPEKAWEEVVNSTIELVDAYESLGEKEITEGLGAGSGELVCKNWKYKARMAVRSVIGRRTKAGLDGMDELKERMESLKGS